MPDDRPLINSTGAGPGPGSGSGNIPEYTVSELAGAVRRTLETSFGRIRARGEITELKRYGSSGHVYFCLKDEGAKLRAVLWKSSLPRAGLTPENGMEVVATGRLTNYADRSEYQLTVERLEYAGQGALLAQVERLRQRLAAEGLFDAARKKPIPRLPALIGVITSAQGAVLHDIRTTVARRFPRNILLWPVPVQGEGAAARIAAAIAGMDRLPAHGIPRPDVLIVARGGGSLEDLMAFNDEAVVRAAAACRLPLISAIGHETDTTLIDHAADQRAPTPTAAAELAVPARIELLADLARRAARLAGAGARLLETRRHRLLAAGAALPDPAAIAGRARQRLDDRARRLALALPNLVARRGAALVAAERHIPKPEAILGRKRARLDLLRSRLLGALSARRHAAERDAVRILPRLRAETVGAKLREGRARLAALGARLDGASYEAVLARGFALVQDEAGRPVTTAAAIRRNQALTLRFADGSAEVRESPRRPQGTLPF